MGLLKNEVKKEKSEIPGQSPEILEKIFLSHMQLSFQLVGGKPPAAPLSFTLPRQMLTFT